MKEFHHSKYLEIDGYDEVQLIDEKTHQIIHILKRKKGIRVDDVIIKNSHNRIRHLKYKEKNTIFTGKFCIIPYEYDSLRKKTTKEKAHYFNSMKNYYNREPFSMGCV